MTNDLISLINKYRSVGILVDTNILLLLFIGNVDPNRIQHFKRTTQFTIEDFNLLKKLLSCFDRIICTPNILSEINSLSSQLGDPFKKYFFVSFSKEIELIDEKYLSSIDASTMSEFIKFGLTDTVTIGLSNGSLLVLTDDFKLSQYLACIGVDTINFNHIRVLGWK